MKTRTTKSKRGQLGVFIFLAVLLLACLGSSAYWRKDSKSPHAAVIPGAEVTVLQKWELPVELTEISGLAYLGKERFACVQDEQGILYIYNTSLGAVEQKISFAGAGDFEGLALVGNTAWALRSDGRLFEINNITLPEPMVTEYQTPLTSKQNVEGLCFDAAANRLLLAIKGAEPGSKSYKGIYAFDLATKKMAMQPLYKITLDHAVFGQQKGSKKNNTIMPSGIAVHPVTREVFITDGKNSRLLVLDRSGDCKKLYQLPSNDFAQPEGISFSPTGDLYICNEGPKKPGNIVELVVSP